MTQSFYSLIWDSKVVEADVPAPIIVLLSIPLYGITLLCVRASPASSIGLSIPLYGIKLKGLRIDPRLRVTFYSLIWDLLYVCRHPILPAEPFYSLIWDYAPANTYVWEAVTNFLFPYMGFVLDYVVSVVCRSLLSIPLYGIGQEPKFLLDGVDVFLFPYMGL